MGLLGGFAALPSIVSSLALVGHHETCSLTEMSLTLFKIRRRFAHDVYEYTTCRSASVLLANNALMKYTLEASLTR